MSRTPADGVSLRLADHFTIAVLPFGIDRGDEKIAALGNSGRWRSRVFRPGDPEDAERSGYFLPYIRRLLFPAAGETRRASCRRYLFDWSSLGGEFADGLDGVIAGKEPRDNEEFAVPVRLPRAELMLFPFDVGFLVMDFRCAGGAATYADQMVAGNALRLFAPLFLGHELPTWRVGERRFHTPQLIAALLAELGGGPAPLPSSPDADAAVPVQLVHDDRMLLWTFSCLGKGDIPDDLFAAQLYLRRGSVVPLDRACLEKADQARERSLRAFQAVRLEGSSKDGGCLVAFNNEPFDETYLGLYQRTYYFDVFLLAVIQRVTLLKFYERLSDIDNLTQMNRHGRRRVRRLRHDLLMFKNQCCFSQITQREKGLVLWRRWQATFENDTLLGEVNDQSAELESYLGSIYRDRVEWLMRLAGVLAAVLPAVLALDAILGDADWVSRLRRWLLVAVMTFSGIAAVWIFLRKPKCE